MLRGAGWLPRTRRHRFNHDGVHVIDVGWRGDQLMLTVETHPEPVGCPGCGVLAGSHGRRLRRLHDIPAFGTPVQLVWRVRRYRCAEPLCARGCSPRPTTSPRRGQS